MLEKTNKEIDSNQKWRSLWQESLLCRLGVGNLVDDEANTALGDDVRNAVANLDVDNRAASTEANHWEQVDNWVCAPADDGPHLSLLDLALDDWVLLLSCGSSKANQELVHNVEEEAHGDGPANPTRCEVASHNQLTVVAADDHESRAEAKCLCLCREDIIRKLHDKKNLNQEQWHSQEPVHVTVGIIEWNTSQLRGLNEQGAILVWGAGSVLIRLNPRVENANVVIGSNESDQTRDENSTLVFVMDSLGAEPEVHGGCHHRCQGEGQGVVDGLEASVIHHIHHHGCERVTDCLDSTH